MKVGTTRPGTTRTGRRDEERERGLGAGEPAPQRVEHARAMTARLELGAGLEGEHDAGEGAVELLEGDRARALGGIVESRLAVAEALEHDEVVEVPEQDDGKLELVEVLDLLVLEALGHQAVAGARP